MVVSLLRFLPLSEFMFYAFRMDVGAIGFHIGSRQTVNESIMIHQKPMYEGDRAAHIAKEDGGLLRTAFQYLSHLRQDPLCNSNVIAYVQEQTHELRICHRTSWNNRVCTLYGETIGCGIGLRSGR